MTETAKTKRKRQKKLKNISEIRRFFHRNETPIYFVSATNFNLLGMDEWCKNFKFINYIDCYFDPELGILSEMKEECQEVELDGDGIEAFPTWVFGDGSYWVGTATFEQLAEFSGCEWLGEPTVFDE